jgi:multiple antibiotic resistance protein
MIPEAALTSFIAALFSMMNPLGNVGVFAGMTTDRPGDETRRIAWSCAAAIAITLLIVAWGGSLALGFFGITVDSLRAAGGVIVLLIGLNMLFNKSEHKHSAAELEDAESRGSIAVVPMAIPIVAGPGTMATVLVAAQQNPSALSKLEISIVVVGMAALCGLLFSFATPISKRLGASGMGVVTRVMGMILAAIAMGMLTEGLKGLLPGLARGGAG